MSYQQNRSGDVHRLTQFVPTYVPHSDYLPTNQIRESNQVNVQQWLSSYEENKRAGRVFTQRPAQFNPARYVSVRTYENVIVNKPISEQQFNSRVRR